MQIAPLIHSRTLYCDFNINFAVRPSDLDVNWAMNKVLQSTLDIDILNGVRLLTAHNGKIGIAGIACNFKSFIENYVPDAINDAEKYFRDERGREIKVFLGYVFKGNGVPNVSYKYLWQMFKENLAPQWEFKVAETVIVPYKNCDTKNIGGKISPVESTGGIDFYNNTDAEKLFAQCINEHKNFCSNVDQYKIISSGEFNAIATSKGNIDRFKSEQAQEKTPPQTSTTGTQRQPTARPIPPQAESRNGNMGLIIGAAAVILAMIIFLIK